MFSKIVFLCFALKLISGSVAQHIRDTDEDVYCYNSSSKSIHRQFATKTAYGMIKGSLDESTVDEGCTPSKTWLLSRHGAVHPSIEYLIKGLTALVNLRDLIFKSLSPICPEDQKLLVEWTWDTNKTAHPEVLSNEGWKEMKTLAKDYNDKFSDLFQSHENVLFRHTTEQRNKESIHGFATELFGSNDYIVDTSDSDMLFKFYENCDKWNENIEKFNESTSDLSKFEKSALFKETIQGISDRLGLSGQLSLRQIKSILNMYRFESAWNSDQPSAWCSAFTQDHINVLEYHENIELYYKTGHGEEFNSQLACKTVVDLLDYLVNNASTAPKVIVSVAEATTIQLFLTALGTHKDTLRPSTDSMSNMGNRKWKSSEMSPYTSNLAVIKYNCLNEEHQVKFFLNQKSLVLDWCSDGVCAFNKFVEVYQPFKENCTECSGKSVSAKIDHGVLAIVVIVISIYLR